MSYLIEKYLGEAVSKYKKEFIKYAYEIIENYMRQNGSKIDFVAQAKQLQSAVVQIMGTMVHPVDNPNYVNMKKFMPKKFNKFLFDNGDNNSYESEWMIMTDAKQFTIAREAMLQYSKTKMGNVLKRSDLDTF